MLTAKQKEFLDTLSNYIEREKISPTIRELCEMVNLKSTSTAYGYLKRLKNEGFITWHPAGPRSIQILKRG